VLKNKMKTPFEVQQDIHNQIFNSIVSPSKKVEVECQCYPYEDDKEYQNKVDSEHDPVEFTKETD
jgi:hypothetical protein